jgi:23S rRNA (adenine2030-N6)-methyltransferase
VLSYRHSFHAGNHADVLKHIILIEILQHLIKKDSAFDYIDTHAGAGLYDLKGEQAAKLQEYVRGVGKLQAEAWPELGDYFAVLAKHNPSGQLNFYPGSPVIAMGFLRPQDRCWLYELHPTDYEILRKNCGNKKRAQVKREDGFRGLSGLLPPHSRRGLVLIDPPYEVKTDYAQVITALQKAYKKFANGIYALWYPVVDRSYIDKMEAELLASGITKIQRFELGVTADREGHGMTASGMIIINPPWTLMDKMKCILPRLATVLGENNSGFYRCDELVGE